MQLSVHFGMQARAAGEQQQVQQRNLEDQDQQNQDQENQDQQDQQRGQQGERPVALRHTVRFPRAAHNGNTGADGGNGTTGGNAVGAGAAAARTRKSAAAKQGNAAKKAKKAKKRTATAGTADGRFSGVASKGATAAAPSGLWLDQLMERQEGRIAELIASGILDQYAGGKGNEGPAAGPRNSKRRRQEQVIESSESEGAFDGEESESGESDCSDTLSELDRRGREELRKMQQAAALG